MELINATGMQVGYTMGVDPSAQEHIVVVVKGTFDFPEKGGDPNLAEEQVPIVEADTFTGEPGKSAPINETDYPLRKPRCDVLLNGSGYAPGGKPAKKIQVGLKVGPMAKVFNVVGDRVWQSKGMTVIPSSPNPFAIMPITYDRAFGGTDDLHPDPRKHSAFTLNPVGCGYHKQTGAEFIDGKPMPNTEEPKQQVSRPNGKYRPMSFGPLGRGWSPRYKLAGTYDEAWLEDTFPYLPTDFQDAYYQAAPADQQIPTPKGGEEIVLLNLTPDGRTAFRLPNVNVPIVFFRKSGGKDETQAQLDTIRIEPDEHRLALTWRSSLPLRRNMFEVPQVLVGHRGPAWHRARASGKAYYRSLSELIQAQGEGDQSEA